MLNVSKEINRLREKAGVLVISHYYEFIRHVANRVVYLKDGVIKKDFILDEQSLSDLNNIFKEMQEDKDV